MGQRSRWGVWTAAAGLALLLVGIGWDAILHELDPTLAERESVFSIANPSHVLLMAGIAVAVMGVAWALWAMAAEGAGHRRIAGGPALGAAALLVLAAATGGTAMMTGGLTQTHLHGDDAAAGDSHDHGAAAASVSGPVADELRALVRAGGTEAALDRLEALAATDSAVRGEGHVYAHEIGRVSHSHYGSAKASFGRCRELFQSGCYHGVLEAHFEVNPRIDPAEIAALCDATVGREAATILRFQCVHGLGHGLAGHFKHDIIKALIACDYLGSEWDRHSCYGGVFMENIIFFQEDLTGSNGHHHGAGHRSFVKQDDPLYPCTAVAEKYRRECYGMQTSIVLTLNGTDYAAAFRVCDRAPSAYIETCYTSMGRDISGNTLRDSDEGLRLCALGDVSHRRYCYVGAVKNFIDVDWRTDQAIAFCGRVEADAKPACFGAIGEQIGTIHADQAARVVECAKVEPEHVAACERGAGIRRQG